MQLSDGRLLSNLSALVALTLLTVACANVADVKLPEGETNLSCGAAIFAATNLVDSGGLSKDEMSTGNYIALVTKYATAYAKEENIQDGMEAFNRVKIEAYRVDKKSSAATIANRARKCAGQPVNG